MVRITRKTEKINIDDKLSPICEYLSNRKDVAAVYLFGSYGTKYQTALSDVDLAVLFVNPEMPDLESRLEIESALTKITGEDDINLVALNKAPITLQFEIVSQGRLLLKKSYYLEDFKEYLFKRYGDFIIFLENFNREYDASLKETYPSGKQAEDAR